MQKVEQRHIDSAREYYSGAFLCEAVLAEQFARFEASLSGGWEDIASAPKDGTFVDLWLEMPSHKNGGMRVTDAAYLDGMWREYAEWDEDGEEGENQRWFPEIGQTNPVETELCKATHWRPLPTPPASAETGK